MKKRIISVLLLSVFFMSITAACCFAQEKVRIGVAIDNFNNKWQTYILDAIREQSALYPKYEFVYVDANDDVGKQIGQVEDLITSGVKGIILLAVSTETAHPMTKACRDAKIPLVTVNHLLSNQEEATAYIGSQSIESGIMEAEMLFKKMNGKGKIAILMGPPGHEATVARTEGYMQVAKKYPGIEFVAKEFGHWSRTEGMRIVEDWLQGGLKFDAVLSNNDEMAIGAILALEAHGVRNKYIVAGIDATPDALEFMKAGRLDITVFQSARGQGKASVDTIVKAVEGTLKEKWIWIPFEPVTPKNAEEYMAKWK